MVENTPVYTIEVNELRLRANHGVLAQERVVGNDFEVTVHLTLKSGCDFGSDNLDLTVNYAEVCALIRRVMAQPSDLLESVCERMRHALLNTFPMVTGGMIRVAKITPPIAGVQAQSVAVSVKF